MMNVKEMMDWCNDYRSYGDGKIFEAKDVVKSVKDLMSKVDINKDDFRLVLMDTKEKFGTGFSKKELLDMTFSEMIDWDKKYANPRYEVILMTKKKPTYLDKVEENYLRSIIAPLARSGCSNFDVCKESVNQNICRLYIYMDTPVGGKHRTNIGLPIFERSQGMYKNLITNKMYSIDYLVE
jgi:hypothetical protein